MMATRNLSDAQNRASPTEAPDVAALLTGDDFLHLWELLNMAEQAMPSDTDADSTRACVRAAKDFLASKQELRKGQHG